MSAVKLLEKIVKEGWTNSGLMIDTTWNIPIELKWEADEILKRRKKAMRLLKKKAKLKKKLRSLPSIEDIASPSNKFPEDLY